GIEGIEGPATARGEPVWLTTYSILAFLYRLFITATIVLFISGQFFVIGILLAIWAVTLMLLVPLSKNVWFLLTSPLLRRRRGRAFAVTGAVLASIGALLFSVPVPHATIAEGVVLVSGNRMIHAQADGVVTRVHAKPNAKVVPGQPVLELEDPLIDGRERLLTRYIGEIERRLAVEPLANQSAIRVLREELLHARADLESTQQRKRDLVIRTDVAGSLVLAQPTDAVGRFVRRGELIGYVTDFRDPEVSVIVTEARADLVRSATEGVEVRFVSQPSDVLSAEIVREVPSLMADLPTLALSSEGGGQIALDPTAANRQQALSKLLHLDLRLPEGTEFATIGERVYVRFAHPQEPLAVQVYRSVRQVFLRNFDL
ncbi:MAG: peptidase M50, partial [Pseudomonadota bacterium]